MQSFNQLFLANLKILYRDRSGFFWNVALPAGIYAALSVLPIGKFISTDAEYSSYVLPGIIAMTVMQGGIYSLAYWMVELKARGVIKRFLATPLEIPKLIAAVIASRLVVMMLQVVLLAVLGILAFHAAMPANILAVALIILLGGTIFLLVGLIISSMASSYQSAAPITSTIGLPLTLLGNIFYPLSTLPHSLQIVARLLPITYMAEGLRSCFLGTATVQGLLADIAVLLAWLLILLGITAAVFRLREE